MTYYNSVSYLYMGIGSEEAQKMGERIAYYEKSAELLLASGKLAKNLDNDVVSFLIVKRTINSNYSSQEIISNDQILFDR
jgi:hypothetical protein